MALVQGSTYQRWGRVWQKVGVVFDKKTEAVLGVVGKGKNVDLGRDLRSYG